MRFLDSFGVFPTRLLIARLQVLRTCFLVTLNLRVSSKSRHNCESEEEFLPVVESPCFCMRLTVMSVWFSREGVQRERPLAKLQVNRLYVIRLFQSVFGWRPQTLITGDLLQFRGGSSTENVSECSYAYLLWAMTNTQLLLTRVPATIGKTMRKAAVRPPLRSRRLGRGHRRVRYPLRRVAAQFNLHKTGQVALPIIEKLAELLGQLRGR